MDKSHGCRWKNNILVVHDYASRGAWNFCNDELGFILVPCIVCHRNYSDCRFVFQREKEVN